jgi:hypothetical protein
MYIDPSTGGMLFQVLAIAFAAISGTVLLFAGRIKMFFARMRRKNDDQAEPTTEDQPTE